MAEVVSTVKSATPVPATPSTPAPPPPPPPAETPPPAESPAPPETPPPPPQAKAPAAKKVYVLKSDVGKHYINGQVVKPGSEVPLTDSQYAAFKDKFEAR